MYLSNRMNANSLGKTVAVHMHVGQTLHTYNGMQVVVEESKISSIKLF